eukprot:1679283-Pyramimonas_sp.AAC.1
MAAKPPQAIAAKRGVTHCHPPERAGLNSSVAHTPRRKGPLVRAVGGWLVGGILGSDSETHRFGSGRTLRVVGSSGLACITLISYITFIRVSLINNASELAMMRVQRQGRVEFYTTLKSSTRIEIQTSLSRSTDSGLHNP